jgi:hypothetical protein
MPKKAADPRTVGELAQRFACGDISVSRRRRLPGFSRLASIAQAEFSAELNWQTLDLLRGLLCTSQMMSTDEVDDLPLGKAASILKTAARQLRAKRLIDGRPSICINCGRPLAIEDRAWLRGWCDDCRRTEDKVLSLDTAFRTENRDPDKYGRDPFDRFREWHAISNEICNRYNVFRVERDHCERFMNKCQADLGIDRESLLAMRRADLVATFGRLAEPPPVGPAGAPAAHNAKGALGRPGRRRKTEMTELEREVWTLYEKHRGEQSPYYEIVGVLKDRFPGLHHSTVEDIVRKIKARMARASRKPAPRRR